MVVEESARNGHGALDMGIKSEAMNGFVPEIENVAVGEGNSVGWSDEGLRTYKRRKHTKSSSGTKLVEDGKVSVNSATQLTNQTRKESLDRGLHSSSCNLGSLPRKVSHAFMNASDDCSLKQRRSIVLEQMYQSLTESEGGLQECIRDALVFHTESGGTTSVRESVHFGEETHKCPSQTEWMFDGTQNTAKGHVGAIPNGSVNESNHRTNTELCKRAFFDVLISEKFAGLCNLLFENFQGMKVGSVFDVSLINSRMKEGAYESSPTLFYSDIEQVWTKLQKVGTEMVSLAKSLSDKSRTSYRKQVGGSTEGTCKDGKNKFLPQESDMHARPEQTQPLGYARIRCCRNCGVQADGRDCLICDSCEDFFHVCCIQPAVEEIPLKSWFCNNCTVKGYVSPHENCVLCERRNAPGSPTTGIDGTLTNETAVQKSEKSSNEEDGLRLLNGGKKLPRCNVCREEVGNGENFRICGHSYCLHKYYHARCLTIKQLRSYGSCWYCPSCLCRRCLTDRDDDKIVLCDGCDHAYHIYCMLPSRTSIPRSKWYCRKCEMGILRIRKARRAYESMPNNLKEKTEEEKGAHANHKTVQKESGEGVLDKSIGVDMLLTAARNLKTVQKDSGKEVLDKSVGVDMLLTAARTLSLEESVAAYKSKNIPSLEERVAAYKSKNMPSLEERVAAYNCKKIPSLEVKVCAYNKETLEKKAAANKSKRVITLEEKLAAYNYKRQKK